MPKKIIIVDDNAINRQLLINVLEEEYEILEAENGKTALDIINREYKTLAAILTDINMPVMDGYELLNMVRESSLFSAVPVIVVTGSEEEQSRIMTLSRGANDFILKPFNPEIVKHCVKNNIALRETAIMMNAIQKDKLTGLYNREAYFSKVTDAIREREPGYYILSCFDINNFKLINNQYGSAEGDRILRDVGKLVNEDMEKLGGIGGRISDDNFSVLFPACERETSLTRALQKNRVMIDENQAVSFSVGRYVALDTSLSAMAMYDRAFIAKQSVKGKYGTNAALFDDEMLDRLVKDQQLVAEMDVAVANRQFEVWFQPQHNHSTGALVGAEALVRWRHPERGLIPPGEFIPLFEKNGFIYELDKYVWEQVCAKLRTWMDEGRNPMPISVNVSRMDALHSDFIDVVTGLVDKYNIPVSLLRFEITESAFAQSTDTVVAAVENLGNKGFVVEIDDFGSGYSSLNTLKTVPAQVIKLDMRFLEDHDDSGRGGNILESVVRMTKWLGMSVIAEGVETREQADFLASIGCSYMQGYLYSKPLPEREYEAYCTNIGKEENLLVMKTVENLDNNTFWNPNSMDTLIFNSYVGAACVFEHNNGSIELLRTNTKFASILGNGSLSVEETLRLDWIACLTPESLEKIREVLRRTGETGEEYTAEYEFVNIAGEGTRVFLRSTMRAIAKAGSRTLVYCTSENITAQKEAEAKERAATEQLQDMIQDMPVGYVRAFGCEDGSLKPVFYNDTYCSLRGMKRDEIMQTEGENILCALHPDDILSVKGILNTALNSERIIDAKYRLFCGNGEYNWFMVFGRRTKDKDGRTVIDIYYTDMGDQAKEEEKRNRLLDNLPGGAGIYELKDGQMNLVYQNKSYWELVGLNEEAFPDTSPMSAVHPDDIAVIMQHLSASIQQKKDVKCDIRLRHVTKGYRYVHLTGRIIMKKDGDYYIYASFTPISDEERSVKTVLPVAIRAMMNSSSEVSFIKDTNFGYVSCSQKFLEFAGVKTESEIIGKKLSEVFPKDFSELNEEIDKKIMQDGKSDVDRDIVLRTSDKTVHLVFSKYPLLDSSGNVVGIYGTGRDMTELYRRQSHFELLANSIPGGIAVYEGSPEQMDKIRLTYFSDGFCRLFGYSREEYGKIAEKNPLGLVFGEDLEHVYDSVRELVRSGGPMNFIYRARVRDNTIKKINVRAVMGEANGANLTVNALFFDVTGQKEDL